MSSLVAAKRKVIERTCPRISLASCCPAPLLNARLCVHPLGFRCTSLAQAQEISLADVKKVFDLFVDVKRSTEFLAVR